MLSGVLVAFGRLLVRAIWRVDPKSDLEEQRMDGDGEFDAVYRLLDNTWRTTACLLAWIAVLVILVPLWGLTTSFRATNPTLSLALGVVGSGVVAFVVAGFCLNMLRMGFVVTLARHEANRELSEARVARSSGNSGPPAAPPGRLVQLALVVLRPTDFDFVLQAVLAVIVFIAVVNYVHAQGYPL